MSTQAAFLGSKAARNPKLSPEAGAGKRGRLKRGGFRISPKRLPILLMVGGFKYFLFSSLPGKMIQFDS